MPANVAQANDPAPRAFPKQIPVRGAALFSMSDWKFEPEDFLDLNRHTLPGETDTPASIAQIANAKLDDWRREVSTAGWWFDAEVFNSLATYVQEEKHIGCRGREVRELAAFLANEWLQRRFLEAPTVYSYKLSDKWNFWVIAPEPYEFDTHQAKLVDVRQIPRCKES
jgi:hypothetical protein